MAMRNEADTTVVLADRPGIGRTALAALIADTPGLRLLAKLSDTREAVPVVRELQPDVVVVDDRLLRDDGWSARELDARLVVVGVDDDPGFEARARRIGAEAWIPKERADALLPLLLTRSPALTRS